MPGHGVGCFGRAHDAMIHTRPCPHLVRWAEVTVLGNEEGSAVLKVQGGSPMQSSTATLCNNNRGWDNPLAPVRA